MANTVITTPVNMEERKNLRLEAGDTIRVFQKIKEGEKFRLQAYEGLVIAVKHGTEAGGTFTVRKVASGVGMEKTFPLYSPMIDKVEVLRKATVRRAKLYNVRDKAAREIRRTLRKMRIVTQPEKSHAAAVEASVAAEARTAESTPEVVPQPTE